jgi:phosphoenolpyruvate carboxykinase (GTP)
VPLATEAFTWQHGTFLASIMSSEKTAAAAGKVGELRFDPMAMLPFCGYNMGDYFAHWLDVAKTDGAKMPRVYYVNWFRKDDDGRFLWPGYGENSRVLKWIFERCDGAAEARETPIGNLPTPEALDTDGLNIDAAALETLLSVDVAAWKSELPQLKTHYEKFGANLPGELAQELQDLENRLNEA